MAQTRVVIADDDPIIRMDLREVLTSLGYMVVGEGRDGASALSLARELRPDVVIMDVKMPGMDGIEAAKPITADEIAPVLLLTAHSEPELVQRATEAGVTGYLVKPFRDAQLGPAIELTLSRFRELKGLRAELANTKDALEARKVIEKAKGLLMVRHQMTEAEAFGRIRKRSMETRKSMREIAEALLLANDLD
jgi:AmiR/NasT family two-component response regulator